MIEADADERCHSETANKHPSSPFAALMKAGSGRGGNLAGQEAFVGFAWGEPVQASQGHLVEFFGDGVQIGLVVGDVGALGQLAADPPVGVLVCPALPR